MKRPQQIYSISDAAKAWNLNRKCNTTLIIEYGTHPEYLGPEAFRILSSLVKNIKNINSKVKTFIGLCFTWNVLEVEQQDSEELSLLSVEPP
jgi:hypothetical protein